MKNKIFTIGLLLLGTSLTAQVSDSVSLGAGYANESYYSLLDGETANIPNNTWDLAFDMSSFGATIRANRLTEVFVYPGGIEDWETVDTAGITEWSRYYNSDVSWAYGALNAAADPSEDTDLGWGEYNTTTHYTDGTRIFILKLQSGDYKKLFIEELGAGAYTFKFDFLDNSDLIETAIAKADYNTQNFIHYSLDTKEVISREPASIEWDVVFSNYHSEILPETYYGVTGVLANYRAEMQQIDDIPTDEASFAGAFDTETNIIGHDWKSFNMDTYAYDIADSLTYFVVSNEGDVWKLIMTGFSGSSEGKIYFTKEMVSAASIDEVAEYDFSIFPNPAINELNISANESLSRVNIYNTSGQLVIAHQNISNSMIQLDLSDLEQGIYIVESTLLNGTTNVQKVLVSK